MRGGLELVGEHDVRALEVLRRGIATSPELKVGFAWTVAMALFSALGRLVLPLLIQQVLDRGFDESGLRTGFVYGACAAAGAVVLLVAAVSRETYLRLVRVAEATLKGLRVRTFEHIHGLSLADHVEARRGTLTARVTSDVETLAQFAQWGAIAWIVNSIVIVATLVLMLIYSVPLTLVTLAVYLPLLPILRGIQRRQLRAYDRVRTRVSTTLSETSEAIMGAPVVRAYGYVDRVGERLSTANEDQARTQLRAHRFFSLLAPLTDLFGALALAMVVVVGVANADSWGLTSGQLVAFLFLVTILLNPIAELGEVLDQTQTALAGWWKILQVLDTEIDVVEPDPGVDLPEHRSLSLEVDGVAFAYRTGGRVLADVDLSFPAGANVAIVGETGSGKTTLAKLLVRLADPAAGAVRVEGVDLRQVSADSRHAAVRMVPQDGFLFATTVRENVQFGRAGSGARDVDEAFEALGLTWWVDTLPNGLDTQVGERGDRLSVGERQLVALARAQLADPGILILDEATSAVDPETEVALAAALVRVAEGRTTISIAHRLSTAERADHVVVMDLGRVVEQGTHAELVGRRGRYAELHESWIGNTRPAA